MKSSGTCGEVKAPFAPSENASTPLERSSGTMPRVTPGTSRCEATILCGRPKRSSRRWTLSMPAFVRLPSPASGSLLLGYLPHQERQSTGQMRQRIKTNDGE